MDETASGTVIAFNEAINRRDLDALGALTADGHRFIDADANVLTGNAAVLKAWDGFFRAFPDYRNDWSRVMATGDTVIALGRSVCATEPALDGPAIWSARTADGKVTEWRVDEDTPANRARLGLG